MHLSNLLILSFQCIFLAEFEVAICLFVGTKKALTCGQVRAKGEGLLGLCE